MFKNAFPISMQEDISKVTALMPLRTYNNCKINISEKVIKYSLNGAFVQLPYRIYYTEISDRQIMKLSAQEKMILHCIYSRSCNGFIREKHIKALLSSPLEEFSIPYIVTICDEYVIEILQIVFEILKKENTEKIKAFCYENQNALCTNYARMTSYWNVFYRNKYLHFKDYIGYKLFKECFGYSHFIKKSNTIL